MKEHWTTYFGNMVSAYDILKMTEESGVSLPDLLHTWYLEMYPDYHVNPDEYPRVDFDDLAQQIIADTTD